MKRCPKCNRSYQTDTQKFCTHDGGLLFAIDPSLSETVQFDSTKVRDAVSKPTTRDLADQKPAFDPEATVVSGSGVDERTKQVSRRNTADLEPSESTEQMSAPTMVSGPIESPQTSAPLPAPQSAAQTSAPLPSPQTSGPIATSAPLPYQPFAQQSRPLPPARAKKSKAPLILGILAILFVIGAGIVIAGVIFIPKFIESRRAATSQRRAVEEPTPSLPTAPVLAESPATSNNEPPPYLPPADAIQFLNSKEKVSEKLSAHYVNFSFYYPKGWETDAKSAVADSENFVEVHRQIPPNFTQESLAISWYDSAGSFEADQNSFHSFAENKSSQFAKNIDQYQKVSEGPVKIGIYDGYEFRFEGVSQNTEKGQFKIWGRVVWLPPSDGGKTGATLLMLATSLAPELNSIDDVGEKGELPMLLESFRFGR